MTGSNLHYVPTCFVISPIGPDGSDIRVLADDFLELLLEPTLSQFSYEVIRADRLVTPTVITSDIVRLVQEADLCIIDLTGHNANVFYECGRRHETGKPFIQMVSKAWEERIPFDVAGIRTITYDLSSARSVLESQKALREFVSSIPTGERSQTPSGATLSTLAIAIERIERKVDNAIAGNARPLRNSSTGTDPLKTLLQSPRSVFFDALRGGDLATAFDQVDRLRRSVGPSTFLTSITILLIGGEERALPIVKREIDAMLAEAATGKMLDSDFTATVHGIKNYCCNFGKEAEGIQYVLDVEARIPEGGASRSTLANIANIVGMLAWSDDAFELCLEHTKRAHEFDPTEPAYVYNLALAYGDTGLKDAERFAETLDVLERFPELSASNVRYLADAGRTFAGLVRSSKDVGNTDEEPDNSIQ